MKLATEQDRQRFAVLVEADRELREAQADMAIKLARVEGLQMMVRGLDKLINADRARSNSETEPPR